jgi:hypothetical protein
MTNNFKIWKTIKVGNYKNVYELCKALENSGFSINRDAEYILGVGGHTFLDETRFCESPFILEATEKRIHLVNLSVADLGFKKGATYKDICDKAKEFGLELCPNEVGPQLRLQYKEQLKKDAWLLYVAIKPIIDFDGSQNIFELVSHGGHLWIDMRSTGRFWKADERFVFCLP